MNFYSDQWKKISSTGTSQSGDDGSSVKRKGGANKGFKDTAGKTSDQFREKHERVSKMRLEHRATTKLWSFYLRATVRKRESERRYAETRRAEEKEAENLAAAAAEAIAVDEREKQKRPAILHELNQLNDSEFDDEENAVDGVRAAKLDQMNDGEYDDDEDAENVVRAVKNHTEL